MPGCLLLEFWFSLHKEICPWPKVHICHCCLVFLGDGAALHKTLLRSKEPAVPRDGAARAFVFAPGCACTCGHHAGAQQQQKRQCVGGIVRDEKKCRGHAPMSKRANARTKLPAVAQSRRAALPKSVRSAVPPVLSLRARAADELTVGGNQGDRVVVEKKMCCTRATGRREASKPLDSSKALVWWSGWGTMRWPTPPDLGSPRDAVSSLPRANYWRARAENELSVSRSDGPGSGSTNGSGRVAGEWWPPSAVGPGRGRCCAAAKTESVKKADSREEKMLVAVTRTGGFVDVGR
mmetsp:Transcript_17583/g.54506  ORF Transcript_17583/g.54506 Transcript_17583/m.54506 type:complete len:293 (+) Transcript_17583:264-1142(+)